MPIDIHAHVFPSPIAARAARNIGAFYDMDDMRHGGGVDELLAAMDEGGIARAVVHSVALASRQTPVINDFIAQCARDHPHRLTGFATMHPDFESPGAEIERSLRMGLRGVKMHNDMQRVPLTDPRMEPIYAACEGVCPLLLHTGDSRYQYDNPSMIPQILRRHPRLQLICAHMGGYTEWADARRYLVDTGVFVDTSSTYFVLGADMTQVIRAFGADRVLFGSDFPMWDPGEELAHVRGLGLTEDELALILYDNAKKLLGE